jgi:hypothetical protein
MRNASAGAGGVEVGQASTGLPLGLNVTSSGGKRTTSNTFARAAQPLAAQTHASARPAAEIRDAAEMERRDAVRTAASYPMRLEPATKHGHRGAVPPVRHARGASVPRLSALAQPGFDVSQDRGVLLLRSVLGDALEEHDVFT